VRLVGLVVVTLLAAGQARADAIIGTTLHYGQALGVEADARLGSALYVLQSLPGGWILGGELSGSLEGYHGGYGCGTGDAAGDEAVPSIGVVCLQPSLAAHVLMGAQAAAGPMTRLRLEAGLGASSVFVIPGRGGATRRETVPSGLVRASYLLEVGEALGSRWSLGLALEERALDPADARWARSVGLVVEGR
jgi:hypothetical protein